MSEKIQNFNQILRSFKIKATCVNYQQIDNYFYYDLKLNTSSRVRDIEKFSEEISLALQTFAKPRVKTINDQGIVRLEFANPRTTSLKLFDIFTNRHVPKTGINCLLGQTIDGKKMWMDISTNPHMIISGTTGSGKSVLLHNIIANLYQYNDVELFLVDPKTIEFSAYANSCRNTTVLNSYNEALQMIDSMIEVMELRYAGLRAGRASSEYKDIVIIIDEFADLILQDHENEFYFSLCRLAQKCRAAKIHIILATQRPTTNIVNGAIKANFPARISCRVASHVDSKVILDATGAEKLLGKGDALIRDNSRNLERFQVAWTTPEEVCNYFAIQN